MRHIRSIKEFISLYYGSLVAQGFNLIIFFFAARYVSLEEIADFFILIALTETGASVASMQSHLTIMLVSDRRLQLRNFVISVCIILAWSVVGTLLLSVLMSGINPDIPYRYLFWFLPVTVVLHSIIISAEQLNIATGKYGLISLAKTIKISVFSLVIVSMFIFKAKTNSLINAYIYSQAVLLIALLWRHLPAVWNVVKGISINIIVSFYTKYADVLVYNTLIAPINILSNQLPFLIIPILFGKEYVANYGILFKTILFPVLLISQVNTQFLFKRMSELYQKKASIMDSLKQFIKKMLVLGVGLYLTVFLIAIVSKGFIPEKWELSIDLLNVLLVWLIVNFVKTPISSLITILSIQKRWVVFEILQLILRCLLFLACYFLKIQFIGTIGAFSLLSTIMGLILVSVIYKETDKYEKSTNLSS
ncbi:lipopolysaccharide biosynthesis protein [Carboxylicivirga taeanensis]|uniref:lipopolysaccharide biosynthesis protein n=1 Tax=Carboxylicivirga taeanensis TaxID=1416875 RepID=UPI003F6DCF51